MIELAGIIILGIFAQWIAWRMRVPAILPLIIIGLIVGPLSTLFTDDHSKWIEPIYDADTEVGIFPGQILFYFVSLAIGIILFEGGLTLKLKEIRGLRNVITKLISVGALVTFIGAGIAAHYIMSLNWSISFLFAGLIIVTGPTVIAPILRNVPLNRNIGTVLKWEGILIDPIGALVAVLVFEFISSGEDNHFTSHALVQFSKTVIVGASIGFTAAYALAFLIKQKLVPHYLLNVFTLALVLGVFIASDQMVSESGLLAVVVMGMVLGNLDVPEIKGILDFKESLSLLLISMLFILLSANITMSQLEIFLDWHSEVLFLVVVLLLRPIGVFLSTHKSELTTREKIFISWVGPRGIVAAGIASLFGIKLTGQVEGAELVTPLVFLIVLGTVLLNATTARVVAKWLGVVQPTSDGVIIVGINRASKWIARYMQQHNCHVVLIDNNANNVKKARNEDLEAIRADIYTDEIGDNLELLDVGYLMAMTSSPEVNKFAVQRFRKEFGEQGTYRLIDSDEIKKSGGAIPKEGLFSRYDDYISLVEVAREYPNFREVLVNSQEQLTVVLEQLNLKRKSIPIFLKKANGKLKLMLADSRLMEVGEGDTLVYVGAEVENLEDILVTEAVETAAEGNEEKQEG